MSAIEFSRDATNERSSENARDGLDYKNQFDSLLTLIERDETRNTTRDGEQQKREKKNASRVAQLLCCSLSRRTICILVRKVCRFSLSLSLSLMRRKVQRATSLFCAERNEAKKEQKRAKFFAIKNLHFFLPLEEEEEEEKEGEKGGGEYLRAFARSHVQTRCAFVVVVIIALFFY